MKKPMFLSLFLALLVSGAARAQDQGKSDDVNQANTNPNTNSRIVSAKAVTLSGQVSADGKALVGDKDDVWEVRNPHVLAGREGRLVTVKCQMSPDKNEIRVLSIRLAESEGKYSARLGDSAFRR
jgi:hypothetical protein